MNAGDIMSRTVIAVRAEAPLEQAVRLMIDNRISGLPVLDAAGHAVGILTEGDLLRRVETGTEAKRPSWFEVIFAPGRLADDYVHTHGRRTSEVMTPDVLTVEDTAALDEVAYLMHSKRVKRLPVTRGGVVVGIVSRADLMKVLAEKLAAAKETGDDATIRAAIMAELKRQSWVPLRSITLSVENGAAAIDGVVFDERQRQAVGVVVENGAGVKSVDNRLIVVEPNTGIVMVDPLSDAGQVVIEPGGPRPAS
ncbi:MAG: CBS domain-containing protein [Acetobacteraceae bacterium]